MDNYYEIAQQVFDREISVLQSIRNQLNDTFNQMLKEILSCKGKLIIIGMGKSGHVAKKIAASMSSLGTCSICIHPGECMHGDLGMIQKQDVVMLISYSGESDEIIRIIPGINRIGATILGITCNRESTLARSCKIVQILTDVTEACPLGLAPTSSTTAVLVYGDALAIAAAQIKKFSKNDFGAFHPAGSLGKKLTVRAIDLMHPLDISHLTLTTTSIADAIKALVRADTDLLPVVNEFQQLVGIINSDDLEQAMDENLDLKQTSVAALIHPYPYFIEESTMAIDALKLMDNLQVSSAPIVKNDTPIGVITRNDIINYGIYL